MRFSPGHFLIDHPPIEAVIAQVGLTQTPELAGYSQPLHLRLKPLGFPIVESHSQATISVGPQPQSRMSQERISLYSDPDRLSAVTVSARSLAFYTSTYASFDEFHQMFAAIVRAITSEVPDIYFTAVSLRYVNQFPVQAVPTSLLVEGLAGIPVTDLPTEHFHHKYEFWCDTASGKLAVRCSLLHGDQPPADLGVFRGVYGKTRLKHEDHVYHLDIQERSRSVRPTKMDAKEISSILLEQHDRIEQAFLNSLSETAVSELGIREKV